MLSKREVECLRWAAAGKTNDEIAIILGLKRTTIRFHIRTAAQKLNAVNRDQALFKAAQLGFLGNNRCPLTRPAPSTTRAPAVRRPGRVAVSR